MRNNQKIIENKNIFSENPEKELRLYSLNFATNLKSETITQNLLTVLKQRVLSKITALTFIQFVNVLFSIEK